MNILRAVIGGKGSLHRNLLVSIIVALSLCLLLAVVVLLTEFQEYLRERLKDSLADEAKEIIIQIDPDEEQFGLDPNGLRFKGVQGAYRFTVFDHTGSAVVGGETSDKIWQQLEALELGKPGLITVIGERIGMGLRVRIEEQDIYVLVSTFPKGLAETQIEKILREVAGKIFIIIFGIIMILAAAILATRRALAPLGILSEQASRVNPEGVNKRLSVEQLPTEIRPLITSVNAAFDRLEQGYRAQRDFASNVAHEIRTPIAVLRSSVDRIKDPELKASLSQDVAQIDELAGQLIDLARADAALRSGFSQVDLRALAVEIASEMAPTALQSGHMLSVTGAERAMVKGNPRLLGIALQNMIRNGLQYVPEGSEIEIIIDASPAGWRVLDRGPGVPDAMKSGLFERFSRGAQANTNSKGSGIGLAIVKSVAQSHRAQVQVKDRDGGGSVFSFIFATD